MDTLGTVIHRVLHLRIPPAVPLVGAAVIIGAILLADARPNVAATALPSPVARDAPPAAAVPEPEPAPAADAAAAPDDPVVAPIDVLPGALTALPPPARDVLPSRALQIEPLAVAAGAAPTPLARPTSRRWYFAYVK